MNEEVMTNTIALGTFVVIMIVILVGVVFFTSEFWNDSYYRHSSLRYKRNIRPLFLSPKNIKRYKKYKQTVINRSEAWQDRMSKRRRDEIHDNTERHFREQKERAIIAAARLRKQENRIKKNKINNLKRNRKKYGRREIRIFLERTTKPMV